MVLTRTEIPKTLCLVGYHLPDEGYLSSSPVGGSINMVLFMVLHILLNSVFSIGFVHVCDGEISRWTLSTEKARLIVIASPEAGQGRSLSSNSAKITDLSALAWRENPTRPTVSTNSVCLNTSGLCCIVDVAWSKIVDSAPCLCGRLMPRLVYLLSCSSVLLQIL